MRGMQKWKEFRNKEPLSEVNAKMWANLLDDLTLLGNGEKGGIMKER